jgi:hypothetical protein
VLFWYFLISLRATVPGLNLCGFLTPPVAGADFRAALVASCFLGALPPVDLRAVCLVRAMSIDDWIEIREKIRDFVDLFCVWVN